MSTTVERLKEAIAALPSGERADLLEYLLTLEGEDARGDWLGLAEKRMVNVRAGKVVGIPAAEVLESMRRPRP